MTILHKNPFFVLNVTCTDSRKVIASAADQLSLINGNENYDEVQNTLINPKKRLSAEIDWFVDLDSSQLEDIRTCIHEKNPINYENFTSLSKLNASLYNFNLVEGIDPSLIRYDILELDEQYSELDIEEITDLINAARSTANMVSTREQDVLFELGRKRDSINQLISNKLTEIGGEEYIELITMLANDYSELNEYDEGVVISDILNQYEIRMQSEIEEKTAKIRSFIEHLKGLPADTSLKYSIQALIRQVQEWDLLVQPLQLKSMTTGMPHPISEEMGAELRRLALYLHNDRGKTEDALTLVEAMQETFAELGQTLAIFKSDTAVLKDLVHGEKDAEEVLTEMNSLRELSDRLKSNPQTSKVDELISRVKDLDVRIKSVEIEAELKINVRKNLCYLARDVAIFLYNEKQMTREAYMIAIALRDEFSDISDLGSKLFGEVNSLGQQLRVKVEHQTLGSQQLQENKSKNAGCFIVLGIAILIIVYTIFGNPSPSTSSTKATSQSPSSVQSTKVNATSSVRTSVVSRKAQLENELQKLDQDIKLMVTKLGLMEKYITDLEGRLDELSATIDYYEQQYKKTGLSTYYKSYQANFDVYDVIYQDYSSKIDEYNDLYDDYSAAIVEYNKKVSEYKNLD